MQAPESPGCSTDRPRRRPRPCQPTPLAVMCNKPAKVDSLDTLARKRALLSRTPAATAAVWVRRRHRPGRCQRRHLQWHHLRYRFNRLLRWHHLSQPRHGPRGTPSQYRGKAERRRGCGYCPTGGHGVTQASWLGRRGSGLASLQKPYFASSGCCCSAVVKCRRRRLGAAWRQGAQA